MRLTPASSKDMAQRCERFLSRGRVSRDRVVPFDGEGNVLRAKDVLEESSLAGKGYHYFLSHKKEHSKHGKVPAQMAQALHDSLELMGFNGWLDVDNLQKITKEALAEAIGQCQSMIVLFNDETANSEWCVFEWATAVELGLPIKVIVDMERCTKALAVEKLSAWPKMLEHQLLDYTERSRRDILMELVEFVTDAAEAQNRFHSQHSSRRNSFQSEALTFGSSNEQRVLHERFEQFALFGGVPVRAPKSLAARLWLWVVRTMMVLLTAYFFWLMVYGTGPAFNDRHEAIILISEVVIVSFVASSTTNVLRSPAFLTILANADTGQTSMELATRFYSRTRGASTKAGLSATSLTILFYMGLLPRLGDAFYIASSDAEAVMFGYTGIVISVLAAPPLFAQITTSLSQSSMLLAISRMQLVAAFDELHPVIAELGMWRATKATDAQLGLVGSLTVTPGAVHRFRVKWNKGVKGYLNVQRQLYASNVARFVLAVLGAALPISMALRDVHVRDHWSNAMWPVLIWLAGVLNIYNTLRIGLRSTETLNKLVFNAKFLEIDSLEVEAAFHAVLSKADLTCHLCPWFPCTAITSMMTSSILLASCIPFVFVDFGGA